MVEITFIAEALLRCWFFGFLTDSKNYSIDDDHVYLRGEGKEIADYFSIWKCQLKMVPRSPPSLP